MKFHANLTIFYLLLSAFAQSQNSGLNGIYDTIFEAKEGTAIAILDGKYTIVNREQKKLIESTYDYIHYSKEGFLWVYQNKKWGAISKNGTLVIPIIYDQINDFKNNLAIVKLNYKFGLINKYGKVVASVKYDKLEMYLDHNSYFIVKENGKYGYLNFEGNPLTKIKYSSGWKLKKGFAIVNVKDKYGVINSNGKEIVPLIYDSIRNYTSGLFKGFIGNRYFFMDSIGETFEFSKYTNVTRFDYGKLLIEYKGKFGIIDLNSKVIIPPKYIWISKLGSSLMAICRKDGVSVVNYKNEKIIRNKYDGVYINSQTKNNNTRTIPEGYVYVESDSKVGILNLSNRKEIVKPIYDKVGSFTEKRAQIELNAKTGLINLDGNVLFAPKDCNIYGFENGIAKVYFPGAGFNYINESGKQLLPFTNFRTLDFKEGLAKAYKLNTKKYGYINKRGTVIIPFEYRQGTDFKNGAAWVCHEETGLWGRINTSNEVIFPFSLLIFRWSSRHFQYSEPPNYGKYGVMNLEGQKITDQIYDQVEFSSDGLIRVVLEFEGDSYARYGFIDTLGKIQLPIIYDYAARGYDILYNRPDSYFYVIKGNKKYWISTIGKSIELSKYEFVDGFYGPYAHIRKNRKSGLISRDGKVIIEPKYDYISFSRTKRFAVTAEQEASEKSDISIASNGYCSYTKLIQVRNNEKYGCIDQYGEEVVPVKYDKIASFEKNNLKYILRNTEVIYKVQSKLYETAVVTIDKKKGLINSNGQEIVKPKYDSIYNSNNGYRIVSLDEKFGLINNFGEFVIPVEYEEVRLQTKEFNSIIITKNNLSTITNLNGKQISQWFDSIWQMREGFFKVKKNGKIGFIDEVGEIVIPLEYDEASDFREGLCTVKKNGSSFEINRNGKIIN